MLYFLNIHSAAGNALFVVTLGVALMLTAFALVFRRRFTAFYMARVGVLPEHLLLRFTILAGVVLGVLVTVSSVGAGAHPDVSNRLYWGKGLVNSAFGVGRRRAFD